MAAKIAWGLTAYGPIWAPAYTAHLRAIAFAARTLEVQDLGVIGGVGCSDRMYTHSAENALVKDFLGSDCSHLFLTEMDMLLPKHTIPALLELDKPIASGLYFLRNGNGQPCLYAKAITTAENRYPHSPVTRFPVDRPFGKVGLCPGLGCVLIAREVFERVPEPWFDLAENKYGSDMYFYTHVRDAEIPVWVHPGVVCDQIDYTVVGFQDYANRVAADPTWANSGFLIGAEAEVPAG